jgi:hypothetical protein
MKNKWELFYNPFTKIAGWRAFAIGAVVVCATVWIGYYNGAYFTGVQMKQVLHLPLSLWQCFLTQGTGLLSMIVLMYAISLLYVKRVRLQDVAGTVVLSRFPYLFIAIFLFYFTPVLLPFHEKLQEPLSVETPLNTLHISDYIALMLFVVFTLLIVVWSFALLYHAFKVSTGIKGRKTGVLFTGILILSEIITFLLMPLYICHS